MQPTTDQHIDIIYHPGTDGGAYLAHIYIPDNPTGKRYGVSADSYASKESAKSAVENGKVKWIRGS